MDWIPSGFRFTLEGPVEYDRGVDENGQWWLRCWHNGANDAPLGPFPSEAAAGEALTKEMVENQSGVSLGDMELDILRRAEAAGRRAYAQPEHRPASFDSEAILEKTQIETAWSKDLVVSGFLLGFELARIEQRLNRALTITVGQHLRGIEFRLLPPDGEPPAKESK